jgi:hypothetical protein
MLCGAEGCKDVPTPNPAHPAFQPPCPYCVPRRGYALTEADILPRAPQPQPSQLPVQVLSDIRDQAVAFGDLLVQLASRVFDLPKSAVKVFLHTTTGTSAFNYGGLLYFNLHRYSGSGRESVYYWYTVRFPALLC